MIILVPASRQSLAQIPDQFADNAGRHDGSGNDAALGTGVLYRLKNYVPNDADEIFAGLNLDAFDEVAFPRDRFGKWWVNNNVVQLFRSLRWPMAFIIVTLLFALIVGAA